MYIVLHHFHIMQSHRYTAKSPIQITAPTSTDYSLANHITNSCCVNAKSSVNNVHINFNGISHISAIGLVPSKTWLRLTPRGPALRVETHLPSQLHAVAKRRSGLRVTSHVIQNIPTVKLHLSNLR